MVIRNGANTLLNQNSGTLPEMSGALLNMFQQMVFSTIATSNINFQAVEVLTPISFQGVWQPFTAAQLKILPEGLRTWSWFMCHADPCLQLQTKETIDFLGVRYRVMSRTDYSLYGYMQYSLVESWVPL
jgi:hypothetical protein